ncbi:MAG: amphi-Trp domain-containing protein [Anaerolineales bacterium]|jgi:amphi-Trp domain-containing protein
MAKETVLFQSEERMDLKKVSTFLYQLADRLEHNQVILQQGTEEITLNIPNNVILEVKVEEEDKRGIAKYSLEVEIEWRKGDESRGVIILD